jgi:hypothetical protein
MALVMALELVSGLATGLVPGSVSGLATGLVPGLVSGLALAFVQSGVGFQDL